MVLANMNFNHDTDVFHDSIGVTGDIRTKCRERIFFTSLSNAIQREELFEDPEDAPRNLHTVSGDLQRLLQSITDNLEYEYTLMIFMNYQRMAKQAYAYYKHMQENHNNNEDRIKSMIMELVDELRSRHESEEEEDEDKSDLPIDRLNKKSLLKRISLVKHSHHNFDTYMNLLNKWVCGNESKTEQKKPDIDDLLKKLFSKDDE